MMDKPLYAGATLGKFLLTDMTTIIILKTLFRQKRIDSTQLPFRYLLTKNHNATPTLKDWSLLFSRNNKYLSVEEHSKFGIEINLFAMNILANNHNKYMLQEIVMLLHDLS